MAPDHHLYLLLLCLLVTSTTAKVPAIIIFGDSTSDTGNNNYIPTIIKSNFPPYGRDFFGGRPTGRFCNGRIAVDFISEALGLGPTVPAYLDPGYNITDFATGVCFASAGTGLDNATADVFSVLPLWKEVYYYQEYQRKLRAYLGRDKANFVIREAIYIVNIGANDFLANYFLLITGRFKQFTISEYENFLVSIFEDFINQIYRLGARKISYTGLGPIGCTPLERTANIIYGGGCVEEYNEAARGFNSKIKAMVARLCARLPGLRLGFTDIYDRAMDFINNPSLYGFENVEEGCCATGRLEFGYLCNQWSPFTCPDANKYLFWDSIHPTERVYREFAQMILNGSLSEFM